ncbi:MAG: hypothetical protein Roseis2KO_45390 [Roseivirga sp.]
MSDKTNINADYSPTTIESIDADPVPGFDYLGCIYKIDDLYARAESVNTKFQLFDIPDNWSKIDESTTDGYAYACPELISFDVLGTNDYSAAESYSTEELFNSTKVSLNIEGSYGAFSGSVEAEYDSSYTENSSFFHVKASSHVRSYRLNLPRNSELINYLKKDVNSDINGDSESDMMDAAKLVDTYGTHFLSGAVFGGQWSYTQSVSTYSYTSKSDAETKVAANYASFLSAGVDEKTTSEQIQTEEQSNAQFSTVGGSPSAIISGVKEWAETVPGNYAMFDFDDDSLQPISELATDPDRKAEIEAAIRSVLNDEVSISDSGFIWDENQVATVYGEDDPEQYEYSVENTSTVIVGLAILITKYEIEKMAVRVFNISENTREWIVLGDGGSYNEEDYELFGETDEGYLMTGIGIKEANSVFQNMVIHQQALDPASQYSAGTYLSDTIDEKTVDTKDPGYDKNYKPSAEDGRVIVGIGVSSIQGGFNGLKLDVAPLVLPD